MEKPIQIFCCYAREDQEILKQLKKHLMPLQRNGQITVWSDTNLNAGVEWEKELHQHLESADIILLLISPDFMASDYCYSKEMVKAMERHKCGEARVIPIILRPTRWQNAPFGKLQVLPTNAKPVTSKGWYTRDEAFVEITLNIEKVVGELIIQIKTRESTYSSTQETASVIEIKNGYIRNTEQSSENLFDATKKAKQGSLNSKHFTDFLRVYEDKLEKAKKENFTFLLIGRSGVGKSSSINLLMGKEVASVGSWESTTMRIETHEHEAFGVKYTIIDTPGLCDDLEDKSKDYVHLMLIREGVPRVDCLWFVTQLDDTRVTSDEKRAIKLISQALDQEVWKHAIIVFTHANSVHYSNTHDMRNEITASEQHRANERQKGYNPGKKDQNVSP